MLELSEGKAVRCILVDRYPLYATGMQALITECFPGFALHSAISFGAALRLLDDLAEGDHILFVLDLFLCTDNAIDALYRMLKIKGTTFNTVLLGDDDTRSVLFGRKLEVDAFLTRESAADEFVLIFHEIVGQFRSSKNPPVDASSHLPKDAAIPLTKRQREIIELLLSGCSNKKIASRLDLTSGTVKNYVAQIMRLFNVRSRLELVAVCLNQQRKIAGQPQPSP